MRHHVYTGSFAELESRWIEDLAHSQRDNALRPAAVLIGSNILATYLRRRVAETSRGAANLRFYTFLDLAFSLSAASVDMEEKPALPHLGASSILESLLAVSAPPPFSSVAAYAGFRDAALDTFRDLRDAGITPGQLDDNLPFWIGSIPDRREHLLGVSRLYRRFRERVEHFRDIDAVFRSAIANAASARDVLGCDSLTVYGVYDVTRQQSDLLAGLKDTLHLTYFVPFVNERVSGFATPFLDSRSRELGVDVQPVDAPRAQDGLGQLKQIDFGRFRKPANPPATEGAPSAGVRNVGPGPIAADGSFALISAPGESRAAVEIVREILRALQDGVIEGFYEAAVILRQPQEQVPILVEAFRLRGMPCYTHGGTSFAQKPLCQAVLATCALESASFSNQSILTAMELTAAALPEELSAAWSVPEWRELTNDARFLAGIESWDEGVKSLVAEARQELSRAERRVQAPERDTEGEKSRSVKQAEATLRLATDLEAAWSALRCESVGWPASLSWLGWSELLERRFEPLFGSSPDWKSFLRVVDELGSLSEVYRRAGLEASVSCSRVTVALSESLSALCLPEGQFQRSGVNLLPVAAARGLRFPLVIIPGLEEGRFPARTRQDPLLLDQERRHIAADALPMKAQRAEEETLLFDMASRSAEKRLILLTSRLDESSDRERIPSQFFLQAASAVCGSGLGLRDMAEDRVPGFRSVSLENPAPKAGEIAVDEGEIRLRFVCRARQGSPAALADLARMEPELLRGPSAFERARWDKRLTEFDGLISDPKLKQWVAQKVGPAVERFSASRLEEYAKCPYLFYLKRVFELETLESQETPEGMNPLVRGEAMHSILEDFVRDLPGADFGAAPAEQADDALESLARRSLQLLRPPGMPDLLWEIELERLLRLLHNWLAFERERVGEGYRAAGVERFFENLLFEIEKYKFNLRGRIDRIDISPDGSAARVVDYKTGRLPDTMARSRGAALMGGEKIQIAIYRCALQVLKEFAKIPVVQGEYLHLQPRDGRVVAHAYSDAQLLEAVRALPGIFRIVGEGLENGRFFARTRGSVYPEGHCDYCDYLPVCGKDRLAREEKKAQDPAVLQFNAGMGL